MNTDYQIWITANSGKEKIQLPVNPEAITIKQGSNNEKINISALGEITILQELPATQFSFSSFFPATYFPGVKTKKIEKPLTLINKILEWQKSKKPICFIVTQCGINVYCSIESFQYSEKGGDIGTYSYSLSLKEYREVTLKKIDVDAVKRKATVKNENQRVDNSVKPKTYTIKPGDNLWNIAKTFYGKPEEWHKIYEANKKIIGGNPNLIYPNVTITIP